MAKNMIDCRMGSANIKCNIYMRDVPIRLNNAHYSRISFSGSSNFNGIVDLPSCMNGIYIFSNCYNLNAPVTIPDSFTNVCYGFYSCFNYNSPVVIGRNVNDAEALFVGCRNFNSPVTFVGSDVPIYANRLFAGCFNFNSPVDFGNRLRVGSEMFNRSTTSDYYKFNQPIHIDYPSTSNVVGLYCNNMLASLPEFDSDVSILNIPQNTIADIRMEKMLFNCTNFSSRNFAVSTRGYVNSVELGNMFASDIKMNSNISISDINANYVYCFGMFFNCQIFNKPVVFPQNVSNYAWAFAKCWNLNQPIDMSIPKMNANCDTMFSGCVKFNHHVTIPYGVGNCANMFSSCWVFDKTVTIPDSVRDCSNMFNDCYKFNSIVHIGSNVNNCESMFNNCRNFNQSVTIPDSVTSCVLMFYQCKNFNSAVHIGDNVKYCGSMFSDCINFNQPVTIPASANCAGMFMGCASLNSPITIPDGVKNCYNMFVSCGNFNQPVIIPDSVTNCQWMFRYCHNFGQDLYVPDGASAYYILGGVNNYKGIISVPTLSYPSDSGITPLATTAGAAVVVRSSGQLFVVVPNYYSNGKPTGGYIWSSDAGGSSYAVDPTYDEPTELPEGAIATVGYFMGCTAYDQPTTVPGSVQDCSRMFQGCSSFDSPVTFEE